MTYHQRTSVFIIKLQLAKGGIGTTESGWGGGEVFGMYENSCTSSLACYRLKGA